MQDEKRPCMFSAKYFPVRVSTLGCYNVIVTDQWIRPMSNSAAVDDRWTSVAVSDGGKDITSTAVARISKSRFRPKL